MQLSDILVLAKVAELGLEAAKPALHEGVLPRAALGTTGKLYPVTSTHCLVQETQILAALVAVQNGWRRVFAQGVHERRVRQLARVPGAQRPANHLSGFEIQYHGQVIPLTAEPQVGKVLYPAARLRHAAVVHAVLGPCLIAEHSIALQNVRRSRNFCSTFFASTTLLAGHWDNNAGQTANAPGFLAVPTKVQCQPSGAVERVLGMGLAEGYDGLAVSRRRPRRLVVATLGNTKLCQEISAPSRFDLIQDGYLFAFCISAVARPSRA